MKGWILSVLAAIGGFLSWLLGGFDYAIIVLLSVIVIDYLVGTLGCIVFKTSTKTSSGGYSSSVGFKGLVKKACILLAVAVGNIVDGQLGSNFIRDSICTFFITNEIISIIENIGLMGIPLPKVIVNALEVLKSKEDKENKLSNIIISNKEKETKQVKEETKQVKEEKIPEETKQVKEKIPEETKHEELDIKIDN